MAKKPKYVCPDCGGHGKTLKLKKAKEERPNVKQAFVVIPCKPCRGTGWVDIQV